MDPIYTTPEQTTSLGSKIIEFIQTLVLFAAIGTAIYLFIAQPHKVSGLSMFPTMHSGDYIITNKIGYRLNEPDKGQIIVFKNPRDESQDFIKRIIGLPGDTIKVQGGHVYVNSSLLNETKYLDTTITTSPGSFLKEREEVTIPQGHYVVMGDNRPASSDSREWGFIARDEIIGEAFFRYFPFDSISLVKAAQY